MTKNLIGKIGSGIKSEIGKAKNDLHNSICVERSALYPVTVALIAGGVLLSGTLAGNAYGGTNSGCKISVTYQDGGQKVTIEDVGCDGVVDGGEKIGTNGERVKFAQDLEDPTKWIALEKNSGEVAFGYEVDKAPYQDKFDEIISGSK